jgi:hypothetical protein
MKYRKNKGYSYPNRTLFAELRKRLLQQKNPVISKDLTTSMLTKIVEDVNKEMANVYVDKQELSIPFIGRLVAIERESFYNPKTKRTNYPVKWGITRQKKREGTLETGKFIYDLNALHLVRLKFNHLRVPHSPIFHFRVCQDVATRLIHNVNNNSLVLYKEKKYGKRN